MQFPESWLREFCDPPISTTELADTLTMAGLEVEELRPVAPPFSRVVVGEIKSAEPHPSADRLRVCQVDAGQGDLLSIVCGAPNARVGIKVPCALVGAELPPADDGKPLSIQTGELRGVRSQGMLCSARELKISDEHGGLLELTADAPVGENLRDWLRLDDTIFTLKLTPNLAHALSVYGIAREVSALTGAPLQEAVFPLVPVGNEDRLPVKVSAPDLCGRFSGRVVRNVNPQARTPAWMVERLGRCGQRSVTALVDISNYVMFEFGRPSHIFDLDKIHRGLDVRWGRAGEKLTLLNGNTVTVDESVGVIADDVQVESLAGIMGGEATAVSDETRDIYVEAAFWWPEAVAGRSRRYNFSTDAGHRFERGVDPSLTVEHIERITALVLDICGTHETSCGPVDDKIVNLPQAKPVTLRIARAAKVIGIPLTQGQCAAALKALGLPLAEGDGTLTVTPPPYRFDLSIEEDLIEEVARMIGYDKLPTTPPLAPMVAKARPEGQRSPFAVRRALAALGYFETINFSFVDESWERDLSGNAEPIKVLNPIASQMNVMRSSLFGSLLSQLKFNVDHKAARVRVFELGRVFLRDAAVRDSERTVAGVHQPMRVGGLAWGPAEPVQWGNRSRNADFFDVKGDVQALLSPLEATFEPAMHTSLHPGRSARVRLNGEPIGFVGELHPKWRQAHELTHAPVLFELDLAAVTQRPVPNFQPVPRRQSALRDLAVIVDESVTHDALMDAIRQSAAGGLLRDVLLFDVYRAKPGVAASGLASGEKSLAVRLTIQDDAKALTDEQIDAAVQSAVALLAERFGARLRA